MKKPQGYLRRHILAAAVLVTIANMAVQKKLCIAPDRRVLEVRICAGGR